MIKEDLLSFQDEKFREFSCKLIPNVNPETVIGVRVPDIRKYAGVIWKEFPEITENFIVDLPHTYHEENQLHMFILEKISDYDECIDKLERFLPYVTNWAVTDGHRFKAFKENEGRLFCKIKEWMQSDHTYTVRFGLNMLMSYFLDDLFTVECNEIAANVKSDEYYVQMMQAWYFATALAKQYDSTIAYIENNMLAPWVNNKTIRKAIESFRISDEQKAYLRTFRV